MLVGRLHKDQRVLDGKPLESDLVCETFCLWEHQRITMVFELKRNDMKHPLQDPRGSGEGTSYSSGRPSYSNDRPAHPYDRPSYPYPTAPYHGESSSSNTSDSPPPYYEQMPPPNTNDRPTYNNERASQPDDPTLLEETDRAIALALSEEDYGNI